MKNPRVSLKDKLVIRLMTQPECLNMSEFSRMSDLFVTTYCLAGLILDEAVVVMEYDDEGKAIGLQEDETPPSPRWIAFETSIVKTSVEAHDVVIQAKARELWAAEYGDEAAELLPFYASDWQVEIEQLHRVTPEAVIAVLQTINGVAAELVVAA